VNKGGNQKISKTFFTKVSVNIWKSPSMQYRRDNVTLRTTFIKNFKFKIIKIRTGCQYVGYLYYSENLNWATHNLRPWAAGWK